MNVKFFVRLAHMLVECSNVSNFMMEFLILNVAVTIVAVHMLCDGVKVSCHQSLTYITAKGLYACVPFNI